MLKKIIKSLMSLRSEVNGYKKKLKCINRSKVLLNSTLTSLENITTHEQVDNKELIVSLTTYSKRIHDVHLVIESIALQTIKPNRLVLWLDENEFSLDNIPLILKKQIERGLEVHFCPNYKSYKKLIPTLSKYPEANIITIDDDVLYPNDMVELLCKEHQKFPDVVIGHRVHKIKLDEDGNILPYKYWEREISDCRESLQNVSIGVGGIFYPAHILAEECLDIDCFSNLAPNADDIWFKAMSLINKKTHKKVNDNRPFWSRFLLLEASQDIALFNKNLIGNENDPQIKAVFEKYNLYGLIK